jgi:hypothetical protein
MGAVVMVTSARGWFLGRRLCLEWPACRALKLDEVTEALELVLLDLVGHERPIT